jgi:hypothetical protein
VTKLYCNATIDSSYWFDESEFPTLLSIQISVGNRLASVGAAPACCLLAIWALRLLFAVAWGLERPNDKPPLTIAVCAAP